MISASRKWIYVFVCLSFLLALTGVQPAYAAGIVVNTNADNMDDDGLCTLREAITTANSNTPINGGDCITGSGPDTITFAGNYTITLSNGFQLDITENVTITGNGESNTIIQAHADPNTAIHRIFFINNATLTLNELTLQNGRCNSFCATNTVDGGAIYVFGTLNLSNVTLANNVVEGGGSGGAIYNTGTLNIHNSTFSNNSAMSDHGGGIYVQLGQSATIQNSTFKNNSAAVGGAIGSFGNVTIVNSTFTGNSGTILAGALFNGAAGTLTLVNSTVSANTSPVAGAMLYDNGGTLHLKNTILANGITGADCHKAGAAISTNINNLIENNSFNPCGTPASTADPMLGALADNGGSTETMALLSGSPAINAGDNATCAGDPVNNLDQRGVARPQGENCDIGAYEAPLIITFTSIAAQDGWVLESTETSNKGGKINSGGSTINIGDDAANKQYRAVLSFNTALPAGAVVTGATLKFKYAGKTGTLPFSTHGKLLVDVKKGAFSNNPALAKGDFSAGASKSALFSLGKSTSWFTKVFTSTQLTYINTSGVTQFRLRFAKDDNNDLGADLLKIHSGSAGSNAPQLIIEYTVP